MKKILYPLLLLILLAAAFLAGSRYRQSDPVESSSSGGRQALYYVDPMNPTHTSEKPGLAPCGMKMEPVYADGQGPTPDSILFLPPGTVKTSPEKQQLMGVKVDYAEKTVTTQTVRTFGRVAVDENRVYRIISTTEGWVREIYGGTTGSLVQKDQILSTLYSRDLISGQQSLFFALNTLERYQAAHSSDDQLTAANQQIRAAEANLLAIGMSETQMKELEHTRNPAREIEIRAPVTGFVLARGVFPNFRLDRNTELYRIADLSRVWVVADIYETEANYLRPGSDARVFLPYAKKWLYGKISDTLPQSDAATRAFKIRLEVDNPEYALRPDMAVDVEFFVTLPLAINIPVDAVLDSGVKKTVFVDLGNGFFEPRRVETGWRFGDRVEITGGLMQGERIVVSGNFLLDSESRIKLAATGIRGTLSRDPVCGMDVQEDKAKAAGLKSEYEGRTYYFCDDQCRREFATNPGRFADGPARMEKDPVALGIQGSHKMHHDPLPDDYTSGMKVDRSEKLDRKDPCADQQETHGAHGGNGKSHD